MTPQLGRPLGKNPLATVPIDELWVATANALGFRIRRGEEAYAASDGQGTISIGTSEILDVDDALAQLVFHELCHALVQGEEALAAPDWGLDNTSARDLHEEHACLVLQAHLSCVYGLRDLMAPTTEYRGYYDALAVEPLKDDGPIAARARGTLKTRLFGLWRSALVSALLKTRSLVAHPVGESWASSQHTCGECIWFYERRTSAGVAGRCQGARGAHTLGPRLERDLRACGSFEAALDCQSCAACCREAYDVVLVARREPMIRRHRALLASNAGQLELPRPNGACVALECNDSRYACSIYSDRPRTCRDFAKGGVHCFNARRKLGLSGGVSAFA